MSAKEKRTKLWVDPFFLPLEDTGVGNWKLGGNFNLNTMSAKGGFEGTYTLSAEENTLFNRAWGTDFSWNPADWWKGWAGQYYYQPTPATFGQRLTELGTAAAYGGAAWGTAELGLYLRDSSSVTLSKH